MALDKIGRYEIAGQIGKGAMGVVYKAIDPTIGRTVALKTMRLDAHSLDVEELLARFRNEARLAGVLNHPNIVTIFDAGEADGLFYIAMEYIEGETLHKVLLQKRALPPEQIIDIARQVCAGLDAAAANRIVHRDIKPANIMLEADGAAKIMDFGIAKSTGGMTSTGQVLGTPNYMSPEQVKGKPLDGRSDLFSFGVILYEMATGEKPFTGDNVTTIIYKIINEEPAPPREIDVSVHPGLSAVIMKALAKSPNDRFQLGADLTRALENYKRANGAEDPTTRVPAYAPGRPANAVATKSSSPVAVLTSAGAGVAAKAAKTAIATRGVGAKTAKPASAAARKIVAVTKKPLSLLTLLPVLAVILITVVIAALSIMAYIEHRQKQQQAELEKLLHQQKTELTQETKAVEEQFAKTAQNAAPAIQQAEQPSVSPVVKPPIHRRVRVAKYSKADTEIPKPASTVNKGQKIASVQTNPASPTLTATGELALSSVPVGADVQIDGRGEAGWHTPFTAAALLPGPHTITFTKLGFAGETQVVEVTAGHQAFVKAQLKAMGATATIASQPPGAAIFVDNQNTGKITPAEIKLNQGQHGIALHKPGFHDSSTNLQIKDGGQYSYSPSLKSSSKESNPLKKLFGLDRVAVHIRTTPEGAQLILNGRAENKSTPIKLGLDPGAYDITLQLHGYKPLRKSVTVVKNTPVELDETLEKQ